MLENPSTKEDLTNVTIFNFDLVNFTAYTNLNGPKKLMAQMTMLYDQVDLLVEKFQLEKLYTIGDSYVVIARPTV